jgi:hypothetical protein
LFDDRVVCAIHIEIQPVVEKVLVVWRSDALGEAFKMIGAAVRFERNGEP